MNCLLPNKEELLPITENWSTFYESGFNESLENMSFKKKLQIITDIVRQTILYEEFPNPKDEEMNLIGDSYTASNVLINYLKKLNLGKNHRCVLAKDYIFEPNQMYSTHFITLLDYDEKTYQIDCTPSIGYKRGQEEEQNSNKFYNNYIEVNEENKRYLTIIRTILYKFTHEKNDDKIIKKYINIVNELPKSDVLTGYIFKCLNMLYTLERNEQLRNRIMDSYVYALNKEKSSQTFTRNGIVYATEKAFFQIKTLKDELDTLVNEDKDYKRQLEIAQCIIAELIKYNKQFDKKLILDDRQISFSNINPRLFLEEGLNVVLLKPSSFKSEVASVIKKTYLDKDKNIKGEYFPNLGAPSVTLGLKPMKLFHPCGYIYERSMYGPGDLFLTHQKADDIKTIKKQLRNTLARELDNTRLTWYDGKEIIWDPVMLNLVHTTDDPCETSLHYLAGYPEYQVMTRFMYPNPKLKILEKER